MYIIIIVIIYMYTIGFRVHEVCLATHQLETQVGHFSTTAL